MADTIWARTTSDGRYRFGITGDAKYGGPSEPLDSEKLRMKLVEFTGDELIAKLTADDLVKNASSDKTYTTQEFTLPLLDKARNRK